MAATNVTADHPLVARFRADRGKVPTAPFGLDAGRQVIDREKSPAALDRDVAKGADGQQWEILLDELEALREAAAR